MNNHPDKLELTAYFTHDCSETARNTLQKHCSKCPSCADYLRRLDSEKSAFLERFPSSDQNFGRESKIRPLFPRPLYALAASLVLLLGGYLIFQHTVSGPEYRTKGESDLAVYVKTQSGEIRERKSRIFTPGEQVQFTYTCGAKNKLILLSIDEEGKITTYYPENGAGSVELEKGQNLPLPNSIILDDYIGKELFIVVFSEKPLSVSLIRNRVVRQFSSKKDFSSIDLDLGDDTRVKKLLITKAGTDQ
ncbi:MAG: DUF4384 domain-containing protein [Chitinivibrionales bacterium]|nr:DUF4384 domain-containing protein [Chitinivibrionales bacterium]